MRPDEHKKRKNDLYKKKHNIKKDVTDKKKASLSEKQSIHVAEAIRESTNDTKPKNEPKASQSEEESKSEDETRKFSRRKIESNWSRYDEILSDEEEVPTQRGEDFNKIFAQSGGSAAQFRFKDEEDWASVEGEATGNMIALDLQDLAQALDCVPLQERLGLNQDLFADEQVDEMKSCAKISKEKYDKCMEHSNVPKINSVTEKKSANEQPSSKQQHEAVLHLNDTKNGDAVSALNNNDISKKSKEILDLEQDIDALLNEDETSKTVKTINTEIKSTGSEVAAVKSSVPKSQTSSSQKTAQIPEPSKNLEDWLDDFLDD